eukprot:1831413-Rhodomonas_salina.2
MLKCLMRDAETASGLGVGEQEVNPTKGQGLLFFPAAADCEFDEPVHTSVCPSARLSLALSTLLSLTLTRFPASGCSRLVATHRTLLNLCGAMAI